MITKFKKYSTECVSYDYYCKVLQLMFVGNSNNNCYEIHFVLHILNILTVLIFCILTALLHIMLQLTIHEFPFSFFSVPP